MRHTLLVLALALAVAACSNDNPAQPSPTTGSGTAVSINASSSFTNAFFSPTTLTTPVGSTVVWTNTDSLVHTAVANNGLWNSNNIAQNGTFSFQFTTAGTYQYRCTIHPVMTGTVVVQ